MSEDMDRLESLACYLDDGYRITMHRSSTGPDFLMACSNDAGIVGTFAAPDIGDALDGILGIMNNASSPEPVSHRMSWPSDFPGKH